MIRRLLALSSLLLLLAPSRVRAQETCASSYESAQELHRTGELRRARAELRLCERACPSKLAADCTRWQSELDGEIASVILAADSPDGAPLAKVRVSADGSPLVAELGTEPVELDPGRHRLLFEDGAGARAEITVELSPGEKSHPVHVRFPAVAKPEPPLLPPPPPPPRPVLIGPWILLGAGALSLGAGATLGILGQVQRADLAATCAPACKKIKVDPIAVEWTTGAVSAGVGAAAVGGAITWWLLARRAPAAAALVVLPGPGSIAVSGRF